MTPMHQLDLFEMAEADDLESRMRRGIPRLYAHTYPHPDDYVRAFENWQRDWFSFASRVVSHAWLPAEYMWLGSSGVTAACQPIVLTAHLQCQHYGERCYCVGRVNAHRGMCRRCGWHSPITTDDDSSAIALALDHCHPGWRDCPVVDPAPFEDGPKGAAARARWEDAARNLYGKRPQGWPIITSRASPGTRAVPGRSPWGGYDVAAEHAH